MSTSTDSRHPNWTKPCPSRSQNGRPFPFSPGKEPRVMTEKQEVSPGNHVATITLSNPGKLNIVNSTILAQLKSACLELAQDDKLRAVTLAGGPTVPGKQPSFIAGADITEMYRLSSSAEARAFILKIHEACQALRALPVPVIAAVHGFSLGAGLEIMAACDLRIATKTSVFGMPEVKVGIPSVVEAALLPSLVGMGRTRRLLYLAENIDAATAERWGLVEGVVGGEGELDAAVQSWVQRLVEMGPRAIRSQKTLMQKWEGVSVDEGVEAGVDAFAEAFADGGVEPKEFMGRFVNRKR
ncbi:ClpP/crotonase [Teratosphaeria nubilosa]|uniref:ClpP/crotonase n=1 Tax=Teratosphaeria nubilosa TaxID=161662 RepID=A0A6G1L933_9PEZI|nr:ClpP/crotonase [Teratosphaeria nubilosa]